jgi:hypothetical protein
MTNKLELKKEMEDTYLIQRLKKPYPSVSRLNLIGNPFSFGGGYVNGGFSKEAMEFLKDVFSFDYMGAAEFEYGAVPEAFSFLYEQRLKDNLKTNILQINNDKIYIISPTSYMEEVIKRITMLAKNERNKDMHLKEYCGLKDCLDPNYKLDKNIYGWVEINNGFMFFIDEEMFKKICNIFNL